MLAAVALSLGPSGQCTLATRDAHEVAGDSGAVLFALAAAAGLVATGFLLNDAVRNRSRRVAAGVAGLVSLGGTAALVLGAILSVVWVCVEF